MSKLDLDYFEKDKEIEKLKLWLDSFLNHELYRTLMLKSKPWLPEDSPKYFPP